jgi:ABC-type phosphate transport system substrate-binding protein
MAAIALIMFFTTMTFAADFEVISNKSVSTSSLGKSDMQAIFLGEKTKWDDGKPIKIAVLEEGAAHKAFLQNVAGKTPTQFESYWKKLVFSGKVTPLKTFGDSAKLADFVASHPGSIGYVASGQAGGSVKTISIK